MKRGFQQAGYWLLLLFFFILLLTHSSGSAEGMRNGIDLCLQVAIPALFPFFVLSGFLVRMRLSDDLGYALRKIMIHGFGLPPVSACALLLGFLGGYPIGAQTAASLYRDGQLTRLQAQRLCACCNNTGPAFLIGMAGCTIYGSLRIGILLYGIHIVSALLVALLFRLFLGCDAVAPAPCAGASKSPSFFPVLVESIGGAFSSCLQLSAFILFFSCLLGLFPHAPVWSKGVLELTVGIASLPVKTWPISASLPLASAYLAFGSCSVLCQTLMILHQSGLSGREAILGKLLHGVLAGLLTFCLLPWFPLVQPVFGAVPSPKVSPLAGFLLSLFLCLVGSGLILLIEKKRWK